MSTLLQQISSPEDLKKIAPDQLPVLAADIRTCLLATLAETGGHLGANLGVVELTIALHYVLQSPRDRIVWDVSHQCYTHKLLTGRRERFASLRQLDGISGFTKRDESEHDAFDAGHGGTSISAALGMARARRLQGESGRVAAVIGDGALTSGMALEALNDAGHDNVNLLVVLNDNAMAISPNVGGMARYLSNIRSEPSYLRAKVHFESLMRRVPGGQRVVGAVERLKAGVKQVFSPGMLFEDLGLTYFGPVDGHDLNLLIAALRQIQHFDGPVLLHVLTTKGKGYTPAEEHRCCLHGVTAFDLESGQPKEESSCDTFTSVFGHSMCRLAAEHPELVAISAAMCDGTGLEQFQRENPRRFFDVGMAEEHAITLAAGMACEGMRPVTAIYSTFSQRAYDQLLHDVCLQNLPVILALDRAGLVGEDGPTHHGVFDLSFLRTMPNLTIMAPATLHELPVMLNAALQLPGPAVIRYPKGSVALQDAGPLAEIAEGRAALLREGNDLAIFAIGSMVECALDTAARLEAAGISTAVVNARFAKPLDEELLCTIAGNVALVVTLEENSVTGGFGSAIHEMFARQNIVKPIHLFGIPDRFIEHGSCEELRERLGLTPPRLAAAVQRLFHEVTHVHAV